MKALRLGFALVLSTFAATGCSDDEDTNTTTGDTGTAIVDTGTAQTDTGSGGTDTGTAPTDTGSVTDTGVSDMGVSDTGGSDTAMSTKHTVDVGSAGNNFAPANLTIKVGDTVEWVWKGDAHTVTESNGGGCMVKSGGFDSGLKNTGATFSRTFTTAGTVNYICTPHCALGMKGSITVSP